MCAIMDNNVRGQVFGNDRPGTGEFFYNWLQERGGRPVVGGKLLRELGDYGNFTQWLAEARRSGRARIILDEEVDAETESLQAQPVCRSNDEHILALAIANDTRLLFTNDQALQDDFRDPAIINDPRGKIYTTRVNTDTTSTHRTLLSPRNIRELCKRCNPS